MGLDRWDAIQLPSEKTWYYTVSVAENVRPPFFKACNAYSG